LPWLHHHLRENSALSYIQYMLSYRKVLLLFGGVAGKARG
jgi:hypothetical protein